MVANAPTGYAHVFLRPTGWADGWTYNLPPILDIGTYRRYPSRFDDYGWLKNRPLVSADELDLLPAVHHSLSTSEPNTKLAVRRLSLASLRDDDDDKLIDACIGIEALLSNDSIEIAHKIATRGATALARHRQPPLDPTKTFKMLKSVYSRRSDLVHGTAKAKNTEFKLDDTTKIRTADLAPFVLRVLLLSKLACQPTWAIDNLDNELLASLGPVTD